MFKTLRYKGSALMVCEKTVRDMRLEGRTTIESEEEFFRILEANAINIIDEAEAALKCMESGRYN